MDVTLRAILESWMSSGLFGVGAFFAVNALPWERLTGGMYARWAWLRAFDHALKRGVSYALSALLGALPVLVSVVMLYTPQPTQWRGWVELMFPYAVTAILAGQGAHSVERAIQVRRGEK